MGVKVQKIPEGLAAQALENRNGRPTVTQEKAIFNLLHQMHYRMRDAQDCMFDVLRSEAKDHCSGNLAMGFTKAEIELNHAAAAMRNIRDLDVCFPNDPVELDENGRWVPVKDAGTGNR